ncbi:MAG: hypothetical protein ACTSQA_03235, partial [Candidatus Heimdallarchaeaceae archaeon]
MNVNNSSRKKDDNLPNVNLPNVDLPNVGLPNTGLPNAGLPNVNLPTVTPNRVRSFAEKITQYNPLYQITRGTLELGKKAVGIGKPGAGLVGQMFPGVEKMTRLVETKTPHPIKEYVKWFKEEENKKKWTKGIYTPEQKQYLQQNPSRLKVLKDTQIQRGFTFGSDYLLSRGIVTPQEDQLFPTTKMAFAVTGMEDLSRLPTSVQGEVRRQLNNYLKKNNLSASGKQLDQITKNLVKTSWFKNWIVESMNKFTPKAQQSIATKLLGKGVSAIVPTQAGAITPVSAIPKAPISIEPILPIIKNIIKPAIPPSGVPAISKGLQPLAKEAMKYDSAEEFETAMQTLKARKKISFPPEVVIKGQPDYIALREKLVSEGFKDTPFTSFYNKVKEVSPIAQKGVSEALKPEISPEVKPVEVTPITPTEEVGITKTKPTLKTIPRDISRAYKFVSDKILRMVEPAKLVKGELFPVITKGTYGKAEYKMIEFDQTQLKSFDKTFIELEEWYNNNFTDEDLENLMLSRGKSQSLEAFKLQREATKALPKELTTKKHKQAIQEIADKNYKYLQQVAQGDINKVRDYFYGMYQSKRAVDKFLEYWQTTERFIKHKSLPTVADAMIRGLKLKYVNPVTNLRAEFRAIAKLDGMQWMKNELMNIGRGIYIDTIEKAPANWDKINDDVFAGLRVEPNTALLINNLIETNKISGVPSLNTLRQINNYLRTIKFIGSAFHVMVIAKQSIADTGYAQFIQNPKTVFRGMNIKGFKKVDPIFKTPEFKKYIELGGGFHYSLDFEAKQMLSGMIEKINRGQYLGGITQAVITPIKIPTDFVNWMFGSYIPKVKYVKYLDTVSAQENKLGRPLTDKEAQEIIKEGQNFYGMMNERLFGRSGTVTTLLRFVFMSPGFAEGNFRTNIKGGTQWGIKGGYNARRSRYNIINSLLITGILATVGTLILTKKMPEKPKKIEDIRDLLKIDTGKVDKKGRKIMVDLLTYDKDYWNIYFNVLRGKPMEAVNTSITRIGGMKASTLGVLADIAKILQGEGIYDWKENRVFYVTDPFISKALKFFTYEVKRLEPIATSVYKQSRERDIDAGMSAIASFLGLRPTKTEADKREQQILSRMFSLKDQQEELYYYLGTIENPREHIKKYNENVNNILDNAVIPQSMKDEWEEKLI